MHIYVIIVIGIREWFRWYKIPDNKPLNVFGYNEKYLSANDAKEIIDETHSYWKGLIKGKTKANCSKIWYPKD